MRVIITSLKCFSLTWSILIPKFWIDDDGDDIFNRVETLKKLQEFSSKFLWEPIFPESQLTHDSLLDNFYGIWAVHMVQHLMLNTALYF